MPRARKSLKAASSASYRRRDEVPEEEVADFTAVGRIHLRERHRGDRDDTLRHARAEPDCAAYHDDVGLDPGVRWSECAVELPGTQEGFDRPPVDLDDAVAAREVGVVCRAVVHHVGDTEDARSQERRGEAEADELAFGEERISSGARGDVAERFVKRPVTYRREIVGWRRERDRIEVGYVAIPEIDIGHHVAHVEVLRGDVARRRLSLGRCFVVGRTGGERNDEDGRQVAWKAWNTIEVCTGCRVEPRRRAGVRWRGN